MRPASASGSSTTGQDLLRADPQRGGDLAWSVAAGELGRYAHEKHAEDDDFGQPGTMYREVMNDTDRDHRAQVAAGLGHGNWSTDGHASAQAAEVVAGRANRA